MDLLASRQEWSVVATEGYNFVNIGVWYQSGHKLVACYKAIESFRKYYPTEKIDLIEDGSKDYEVIRETFNVNLTQIDQSGQNFKTSGRPIYDLQTNLMWLKRIYNSATGYLSDVDYIILFEDDVWCKRKIEIFPTKDLEGANGPLYTPELFQYLKTYLQIPEAENRGHWSNLGSLESYGACGGTIFNRKSFLIAYDNIKNIDWETVYKLDSRPVEWSDASLSFIFQHAGLKTSMWNDWAQYDTKNLGNWFDKTGWSVPMNEQPDKSIIHLYKHFYNYKNEELQKAIEIGI